MPFQILQSRAEKPLKAMYPLTHYAQCHDLSVDNTFKFKDAKTIFGKNKI